MMMDMYKPSADDLQPLLDQATDGQSLDQWIDKFLANLKSILVQTPLRYRTYGPYWWPLKKTYVDREDLTFGDYVDAEWFSAMNYGKPELNILAAFLYEDMRTSKNMIDDPFHVLEASDGSDSVEFASNDPEMEMMGVLLR